MRSATRWLAAPTTVLLLSLAAGACDGADPDPLGVTERAQSEDGPGMSCAPGQCSDVNGVCQTCMCPLYPLEESKDATANNKRAPGVAVPEGTTQAVSPCNSGKYDGPEALRCPRLSTDYPLPAGCKDQNRVDGWSASWLICEGSRGPIRSGAKCGGQCPDNMQYLYDRLAKNCAGNFCGGTSPADCVRCLQKETQAWLGSGPVCGVAATCMTEVLSKWYPGKCTMKCNSSAPGANQETHAWMECSLDGKTFTFDGNNGVFYSCPNPE